MAGSVNKVILIGNLGKDPEIRRLENGTVVASFPIATSETYTDKSTNERREITDWHNVVVWRGLAEVVEKYVRKGSKLYVEGKLKSRSYQDKEGVTRYITEIVADEITMLSRNENGTAPQNTPNYSSEGTPSSPSKIDQLLDDSKDDLPF